MSSPFEADALTTLYNGTTLQLFRTYAATTIKSEPIANDIDALDRRIATFEKVTIPAKSPSPQTSADYPYDEAGLKREFMEEVLALLIRSSNTISTVTGGTPAVVDGVVMATIQLAGGTLVRSEGGGSYYGGAQQVLYDVNGGTLSPGTTDSLKNTGGFTNFANYDLTTLRRHYFVDGSSAAGIFQKYQDLIDQTFQTGAELANNTSAPAQVVTSIPTIVIDGVSYSRLATVPTGTKSAPLQYLLDDTAATSSVARATDLSVVENSADTLRLQLSPQQTGAASASYNADAEAYYQDYVVSPDPALPGVQFTITLRRDNRPTINGLPNPGLGKVLNFEDITLATNDPANPLVSASPDAITLPMFDSAGYGTDEYDPLIPGIVTSRRFSVGATDYLISLDQKQSKVYVTSLGASKTSAVTDTGVRSLTATQYLLHMNEVRIKILRGQLAYNEAVVREIQDDLRRANDALADLEEKSGSITTTDSSGLSTETIILSLFNAVASKEGASMFERWAGGALPSSDSIHGKAGWGAARTALKNYIDRRSSEAQQATLDYQNVLNRYNGAYETMAKLQEKLDNLLKGQLRNLN